MPHHRTNALTKYIDIFGEQTLIEIIEKARNFESPGSIVTVTNPILRFLVDKTYVSGGKLCVNLSTGVEQSDHSQFHAVSGLLNDLKSEILANTSYRDQLARSLLNRKDGSMLSALNEILVAGYYKSIGINVELNSSVQSGAADIDLIDMDYATDTKTFPNKRLYLEDIVNNSANEIAAAAEFIKDEGLLISVFSPNTLAFKSSMLALATKFKEEPKAARYEDDIISAIIMDNEYSASDFSIKVMPQNVNVFFQASWDMGPSIDELKNLIEKAVLQSKTLGKKAIPFILVPRDAGRNAIEMNVIRVSAGFHQYVQDHDSIYIMPLYSLDFNGNKVEVSFDVYQTGDNTLGINFESFKAYIDDLIGRVELVA